MSILAVSKGVTSVGGLLGIGTGVYYGANSRFNDLIRNWGNTKGWLLYEGRELVGEGERSVEQWIKAYDRYKSYFAFKVGTDGGSGLKVLDFNTSVNENRMQWWCERQFKSNGGGREYGKVRKWCTKHETLKDRLDSEGMKLGLDKQNRGSYDTLLSKLSGSIEDEAFLKIPPSVPPLPANDDNESKKIEKAKSWCEHKANTDTEDGEEHYGIFKEVCGEKK